MTKVEFFKLCHERKVKNDDTFAIEEYWHSRLSGGYTPYCFVSLIGGPGEWPLIQRYRDPSRTRWDSEVEKFKRWLREYKEKKVPKA